MTRSQEDSGRSLTETGDKQKGVPAAEAVDFLLTAAERDLYRDLWLRLTLRNHMLGIELLSGDERAMEEKLVRVVAQLFQSEKEVRRLQGRLREVIEVYRAYQRAKAEERPKRLAQFESLLRQLEKPVPDPVEPLLIPSPNLARAEVVHFDAPTQLVVLNVGESQKAQPGLVYQILRDDEPIGRVRLFEIREVVSAGFYEALKPGFEPKRGDQVRLEMRK